MLFRVSENMLYHNGTSRYIHSNIVISFYDGSTTVGIVIYLPVFTFECHVYYNIEHSILLSSLINVKTKGLIFFTCSKFSLNIKTMKSIMVSIHLYRVFNVVEQFRDYLVIQLA